MTDEISIQQSQSNSGAYALGGATLGGIAGGVGAHYLTKPKYGSYEDIIKEAKDSAEFSKKIEKAEGEEKKFLERIKEMASKEETAGAEYDRLLEEYKTAHKDDGAVIEDQNFKDLKAAQTKAEADLAAKKQALINEQIKLLKEGSPIDPRYKAGLEKTIKNNKDGLEKWKQDRKALATEADNVVSGTKTYEYEHPVTKRKTTINFDNVLEAEENFKKELKAGKTKMYFEEANVSGKGTHIVKRVPKTPEEISAAKKFFYQQQNAKLKGLFSEAAALNDGTLFNTIVEDAKTVQLNKVRMDLYRTGAKDAIQRQTEQLVNDYVKAETDLKGAKKFDVVTWAEKRGKTLDTTNPTTGVVNKSTLTTMVEQYNDAKTKPEVRENLGKQIRQTYEYLSSEDLKALNEEKKMLDIYRRMKENKKSGSVTIHWSAPHVRFDLPVEDSVLTAFKKELQEAEPKNKERYEARKRAYEARFPGKKYPFKYEPLKNVKTYEEYVAEAEGMKLSDIKSKIKSTETRISNLETNIETYTEYNKLADRLKVAEQRIQSVVGKDASGKYYTVKKVGGKDVLVDSTGKVYDPEAKPRETLREKVELPETDKKMAGYEQRIARDQAKINGVGVSGLSEEEITRQATEAIDKNAYKAEAEAAEKAKNAVEEARGQLKKGEAKTAEQLTADFVKEKGERTAFIENATKEAETSIKNDCKEWLQRKWGFAEHTNWKIAGAVAAGAVVIGGLAAMLAPKKDQA